MKYIITEQEFIKILEGLNINEAAYAADDAFDFFRGKKSASDIFNSIVTGEYTETQKRDLLINAAKNAEEELDDAFRFEVNKRKGFLYLDKQGKNIMGIDKKSRRNPKRINLFLHFVDLMFEGTIEQYEANEEFKKEDLQELIYGILYELYLYEKDCTDFLSTAQIITDTNVTNLKDKSVVDKIERYNNSIALYTRLFKDDLEMWVFDYYTEYMQKNIQIGDLKREDNFYFVSGVQLKESYTNLKKNGFSYTNFLKLLHGNIDKEDYTKRKFIAEYTPFAGQAQKGRSFINSWFNVVLAKYAEVNSTKHYQDFTYDDFVIVVNSILNPIQNIHIINQSGGQVKNVDSRNVTFVNAVMLLALGMKYDYRKITFENWEADIENFFNLLINEKHPGDDSPIDAFKSITGSSFKQFDTRIIYDDRDLAETFFINLTGNKKRDVYKTMLNKGKANATDEEIDLITDYAEDDERRISFNTSFNPSKDIYLNFVKNYIDIENDKKLDNTLYKRYKDLFYRLVTDLHIKENQYMKTFINEIRNPVVILTTKQSIESLTNKDKSILTQNILEIYNIALNKKIKIDNIDLLLELINIAQNRSQIELYKPPVKAKLDSFIYDYIYNENLNIFLIFSDKLQRLNINSGDEKKYIDAFNDKIDKLNKITKNIVLWTDETKNELVDNYINEIIELEKNKKEKETKKEITVNKTEYEKIITKTPFNISGKTKIFETSLENNKSVYKLDTIKKLFSDNELNTVSDLFLANKILLSKLVDDNNKIVFSKNEEEETRILYYNIANIISYNKENIKNYSNIDEIVKDIIKKNDSKINSKTILITPFTQKSIETYFKNKK